MLKERKIKKKTNVQKVTFCVVDVAMFVVCSINLNNKIMV